MKGAIYLRLGVGSLVLGLAIVLFIFRGPRDYLSHVPAALQAFLHPYVLILAAEMLMCFSAACFATWCFLRDDSK